MPSPVEKKSTQEFQLFDPVGKKNKKLLFSRPESSIVVKLEMRMYSSFSETRITRSFFNRHEVRYKRPEDMKTFTALQGPIIRRNYHIMCNRLFDAVGRWIAINGRYFVHERSSLLGPGAGGDDYIARMMDARRIASVDLFSVETHHRVEDVGIHK